jgi:hypothetical protein
VRRLAGNRMFRHCQNIIHLGNFLNKHE